MFSKSPFIQRFRLVVWLSVVLACPVFGAGLRVLPGHVPSAIGQLTASGHVPASSRLRLSLGLPLRDPAGLSRFLAELYNPASPSYRKFLTPAEFTERFGPTAADYAAMKTFAQANGFKIEGEHGNRLLLDVSAEAADVERAFRIKLNQYRHPTEAREFFAPDTEPSVDSSLALVDIQGLSDFYRPQPRIHKMDPKALAARNGSAPDGSSYLGDDFRTAYAPGVTLTGAGQSVGLLQFDAYYASDIQTYAQTAGGGRANIQVVAVPVGVSSVTPGVNGGSAEVSLDIEMAMAMAPGLSKIYVFETTSTIYLNSMLNAMAASNTVKNLSCSWGWGGGPNTTRDNIFQQMATQGQSFFSASGDSCAFTVGATSVNGADNTSLANSPSSCPYITVVGGTTLTSGSGAAYSSETVWNWGNGQGSSGGVSSYYSIPSWQTGISMTANLGSTTQRNIPDVALTADQVYVYYNNGSHGVFGGTSCAAPLWAGFMALVNQQAASLGNPSAGFINPAVYTIGKGLNPNYSYADCFHDTATGNNYWSSSPSQYPAVAGYDLCTGWGTPNGQNLINALAGSPDPLALTPASGFAASGSPGGPFSPSSQNFTLTNSGASSLDWSVINTSAWLNVSSASGTLPAAGQTTVTIALSSAANNLASGNYAATVGVTNQTSHALQNLQFTLQIFEPLVLLTTNSFTTAGAAGGPFSPGSQAVVFTNLGASSLNWSIINTSAWLSVSSTSGSLAGYSAASVTVATNSGTAALANGSYTAALVLSNQFTHGTQNLTVKALVGQNIVQNGGFETGDFTSWTQSGNTAATSVTSGNANFVHGGTYGAKFGPSGSLGYISQTLPTSAGQTYYLSLWLGSPDGKTPNRFTVGWNGSTIFDQSSLPKFGWTNLHFIVTATTSATTLQLGLQDNPAYLGLDDVSVTPVFLPAITQQPASQTNFAGSNVVFTAVASGTAPLGYQWRTNGINLANGMGLSGATSNILTLTAITASRAGNYTLVVTNPYGSATSSSASLTVLSPAAITTNLVTKNVECGGNVSYTVGASGTPPLAYLWKLDGIAVAGATNSSLSLTNIHLPNHTVVVVVANLYGSATNSTTLTVQDTLPPVVALNGANPSYVELGNAFADPGATALDTCAGGVPAVASGSVNTNAVSTNTLTYTANDGNGNTGTATRVVFVRDTTPPIVAWSFTNLVLVAGTNTSVPMPVVTGTNFIVATDRSGAVTVTQNPANNFPLPLGTNAVFLTVADVSGNAAVSTNVILVVENTNAVPVISQLAVQGGGLTLQLSGGYGLTYVLESATDLVPGAWLPMATNTVGITGVWQFTDPAATGIPARFYRLRLVP